MCSRYGWLDGTSTSYYANTKRVFPRKPYPVSIVFISKSLYFSIFELHNEILWTTIKVYKIYYKFLYYQKIFYLCSQKVFFSDVATDMRILHDILYKYYIYTFRIFWDVLSKKATAKPKKTNDKNDNHSRATNGNPCTGIVPFTSQIIARMIEITCKMQIAWCWIVFLPFKKILKNSLECQVRLWTFSKFSF